MNCTHHDFTVLLFVYVLVTEHVAGTQHCQLASLLHETKNIFQHHKYTHILLQSQNYVVLLTFP